MVHAVEIAARHYISIPYQKFTEKIIAANGFLCALDENLKDTSGKETVKEAKKEIRDMMEKTSPELYISLFELDRWVDPDTTTSEKIIFRVHDSSENAKHKKEGRHFSKKEGGDYYLQMVLCFCINRVNEIVMQMLEKYSVDFPLKGGMSEW
jgi:hypothetical protein